MSANLAPECVVLIKVWTVRASHARAGDLTYSVLQIAQAHGGRRCVSEPTSVEPREIGVCVAHDACTTGVRRPCARTVTS